MKLKLMGCAVFASVCVASLFFAGCGGTPSTPQQSDQSTPKPINRALNRRLDAVVAVPLVIPVDDSLGLKSLRPKVTCDDGTLVPSSMHRVLVQVTPPGPGEAAPDQWLPVPGVWSSIDVGDSDVKSGSLVLLLDPPARASGQGLIIDGVRFPVNWIPNPATLVQPAPDAQGVAVNPWKPVLEPGTQRAVESAGSERINPLTRWRYRMLVEGLDPLAQDQSPFEDSVIEAIAAQNENRWRVALAWLWSADAPTAWRLKRMLGAVVRFPDGRLVPAWSTDHADLDLLLQQLLDPMLQPQDRKTVATDWIDRQRTMTAWITDDGGILDDSRAVIATGAVANLTDQATTGWYSRVDAPSPPELQPIGAFEAAELAIPLAAVRNEIGDISLPTAVVAQVGRAVRELSVISGRHRAEPPGVRFELFHPDWTLPAWRSGTPLPERGDWQTRARMYKVDSSVGESTWELFVQCSIRLDVGSIENEQVVIAIGPTSKPRHLLQVTAAGQLSDQTMPRELARVDEIDISRSERQWAFRVVLPRGAVEADGTLRIGIFRRDAAMRRTSWPRAAFPWQTAPCRAAVDTTSWSPTP